MTRGPLCLALLTLAGVVHAQSGPRASAVEAERVAADFFAWYVPMARSDPGPALRAIRERRAQFSATIVYALRADSAATARGGEEVDGLDADPFLSSQDPCERYQPVRTARRGRAYLVEVRGSGHCPAHQQPDVTVAIVWRAAGPVFVNFLYSRDAGDDLVSHLRELADRRRRSSHLPGRAGAASDLPVREHQSAVGTTLLEPGERHAKIGPA